MKVHMFARTKSEEVRPDSTGLFGRRPEAGISQGGNSVTTRQFISRTEASRSTRAISGWGNILTGRTSFSPVTTP